MTNQTNQTIGRQVLPIPDADHVGLTTYDAKDPETSFPPIEPLRPPAGAPNVLVVLLDDAGFGSSSAFGGPIATPELRTLGGRAGCGSTGSTRLRCARRPARRC